MNKRWDCLIFIRGVSSQEYSEFIRTLELSNTDVDAIDALPTEGGDGWKWMLLAANRPLFMVHTGSISYLVCPMIYEPAKVPLLEAITTEAGKRNDCGQRCTAKYGGFSISVKTNNPHHSKMILYSLLMGMDFGVKPTTPTVKSAMSAERIVEVHHHHHYPRERQFPPSVTHKHAA